MEPSADTDGDGIIPEIDATAQPAVLVTIGRALQRSFGAVLIILGVVGFLVVTFGKWLTRRAGQVVTKDDILAGVWTWDFEGDPNIVEVYVRRLRRKIDEPYGRHTIETVRGAGYRVAHDGA